ncbi:hypothetical protein HBB16_19800 [Pseudonocardia sp. MCCB 268]|nr:hypothetical protein [Pseudonocardia cytotoxica]
MNAEHEQLVWTRARRTGTATPAAGWSARCPVAGRRLLADDPPPGPGGLPGPASHDWDTSWTTALLRQLIDKDEIRGILMARYAGRRPPTTWICCGRCTTRTYHDDHGDYKGSPGAWSAS